MKDLLEMLEKAYISLLVVMTSIIVILGIYQVTGRYLVWLHLPITWTEEAMRYLYVAIVMLGIGAVAKAESFTTITLFSDMIKRRSRVGGKILNISHNFVQALFFALMLYYGAQLVSRSVSQTTATTKISFAIVYLPIPIGGLMGFLHSILKIRRNFGVRSVKEVR